MELMIEEAIQHIKNSCYIVGYPTHDRQDETRKRINASLDMAIDTMRKYQKMQAIAEKCNLKLLPKEAMSTFMKDVLEVLEDGPTN
jgi:hypothetical protein